MSVRRVGIVVATAAAGMTVFTTSAVATPPTGDVVRTDLAKGDTVAPVTIVTAPGQPTSFVVQSLLLKPGSSSGWHTHTGPEFSVVTDGAVAVQTAADCSVVIYAGGQAVFIPANVPHRVANETSHDAGAVVTYTVPANAPVRVDAPDVCQK